MEGVQITISGKLTIRLNDEITADEACSVKVKILNQEQAFGIASEWETKERAMVFNLKGKPNEFGSDAINFTVSKDSEFKSTASMSFVLFGQKICRGTVIAKNEEGDEFKLLWCFEVLSAELQNLLEICIPVELVTDEVIDVRPEWQTESKLSCTLFQDELEFDVDSLPHRHLIFIEKEKKTELQEWIANGKMEIFFRREGSEVHGKSSLSIGDAFDTRGCFLHYEAQFLPIWSKDSISRTDPFQIDGVRSTACMKIRTASQIEPEPPQPFNRAVFIFKKDDDEILKTLVNHVFESNMRAMNLEGPMKQCFAIQLDDEQKASLTLDFLTGFHVLDSKWRIFVVEGISNGDSMKELYEKIPKIFTKDRRFLLNASVTFKNRQYVEFDLTPKTITLTHDLVAISKSKETYLSFEPMLHEAVMDLLFTRERAPELRKAKFPTTRGLNLIEDKFGGFVSESDLGFEEREIVSSRAHTTLVERICSSEVMQMTKKGTKTSDADDLRKAFEELTKKDELTEEASAPPRDLVREHIERYTTTAEELEARKQRTRIEPVGDVYIYGSQRLNFKEKNKRAQIEREKKSGKIKCFSNDFQCSELVENFSESTAKYNEREASRKKFTNPNGFSLHTLSHSLPENQELYLQDDFIHPKNSNATLREFPFIDHTYKKSERGEVFTWNPNPKPNQAFGFPGNEDWGKPLFKGDDGETQSAAAKRKQREAFVKKMVVDTLQCVAHLAADARKQPHLLDTTKGMRVDSPATTNLKISTKKEIPNCDVLLLDDAYDDPVDPLVRVDCKNKWTAGEFNNNIQNDSLHDIKKHVTKIVPTRAMASEEKVGKIWGTR